MRKKIALAMALAISVTVVQPCVSTEAATKLKVSNTKIVLKEGQKKTITANRSVKWKISNRKIVSVKRLSTKKASIIAKKAGKCNVVAVAGKIKTSIKVTVTAKKDVTTKTQNEETSKQTQSAPVVTKGPEVTATPVLETSQPTQSASVVTTKPEVTATPVEETSKPTQSVPAVTTGSEITATPEVETSKPTQSAPAVTTEPEVTATPEAETSKPTQSAPAVTTEPAVTVTPGVVTGASVTMSSVMLTVDAEGMAQLSFVVNNNTKNEICYNYANLEVLRADGTWAGTNGYYPTKGNLKAGETATHSIALGKMDGTLCYTIKVVEGNTGKEYLVSFVATVQKEQAVVLEKVKAEGNQLTYKITNNCAQKISYQYSSYAVQSANGDWALANLYVPDLGTLEVGESKEVTVSVMTDANFRYGIKVIKEDGQIEYSYLLVENNVTIC